MENNSLIEAQNITVEIHSRKILEDVSVSINCGEVLAVLGANGAGKSTLRKVLCGDLAPTAGAVSMNGKALDDWTLIERAKARAVLPQDSTLNFPFAVLEVVLMGRAPHVRGTESRKDYEIARAALEAVEAEHLEDRIYPTLSGGERQRVHLARVLAQIWESSATGARYLLLDEPTSNLDLAHQHETLKIARKLAVEGVGLLVILHDLNLAARYADKVMMLKDGKIIAFGSVEEVFTAGIIDETFGVNVSVIKHPFFDCPLIIWRDDADISE
ncbi:MAG TPA: heme ABC transporter ATP-binding protein [Pyrinomonadaceae bacterium]|jgi:iron complex transport system ATP-binding protein